MRAQAVVLAYSLLASALLCRRAAASPAFIVGKLVMGGLELRRPVMDTMTANQSTPLQLSTAASDGNVDGLHPNWLSLLPEITSPLDRNHPFGEQGIVLDHLLVFLVLFVVYIFR
ncbi:hypothetical protein CFC21_035730 [Triticum aestivum]|uniref:Uncharacterized protein n=3 Tax=Triticum TaxID=4564 RepID=A0A9R0VK63_TRITD|nr:uncharacterized protein LOC119271639 [Triticum dicoccoides]XP_044337097.1 uncharacterized protein LOC123058438 [Triticum aestivum]KAF7023137.1 hypothetical protein CFC21_035730 [Triticum aestivum]VAH62429.1 unnamed protein product [Triticum turgidum subsp. durum]